MAIVFQNLDFIAHSVKSCTTNGFGGGATSEFGSIFKYQLSAMVFSFGTIGFMAAYAMTAMSAVDRANDRVAAVLQPFSFGRRLSAALNEGPRDAPVMRARVENLLGAFDLVNARKNCLRLKFIHDFTAISFSRNYGARGANKWQPSPIRKSMITAWPIPCWRLWA